VGDLTEALQTAEGLGENTYTLLALTHIAKEQGWIGEVAGARAWIETRQKPYERIEFLRSLAEGLLERGSGTAPEDPLNSYDPLSQQEL